MNIKRGDKILITTGKDAGKSGKVEKAFPKKNSIIVSGMNIAKKHLKKSSKNPYGGIIDIAMPITRDNVKLICPRCEKSTRIGFKITPSGKVRICKKCNESVDDSKK
jgi:large subunit ribosomal protein L24